jgi:hypothetical protein
MTFPDLFREDIPTVVLLATTDTISMLLLFPALRKNDLESIILLAVVQKTWMVSLLYLMTRPATTLVAAPPPRISLSNRLANWEILSFVGWLIN